MEDFNDFHLNSDQSSLQAAEDDDNKAALAKIARANRKQKLANKKTNPSSSSSRKPIKKTYVGHNKGCDQDNQIFYTQDNVKLSLLLRKILTRSDVGELGRILLPKREVEENLPDLATKEGVDIILRDAFTNIEWRLKLRFWANQKGSIYLLDQCNDFVRRNSLEAGDHLELYHDEQKNIYFTIQKKEMVAAGPSDLQKESENNLSIMLEATEEDEKEEDLSWRVLVDALRHNEQDDGNSLNSL